MSFLSTLQKIVRRESARESTSVDGGAGLRAASSASYESLQPSANDPYWAYATGADANSQADPDFRKQIRNRARLERQNNAYANGIVCQFANDTIGNGPRLQIVSDNQDAANRLEDIWQDWWEEVGGAIKLHIMKMAKTVDGESFAVMQTNGGLRHSVKLDFMVYEADFFQTPWDYRWTAPENVRYPMYDGIEFDQWGNPAKYWRTIHHPGATYPWILNIWEYESVPADYVIHLYRSDRPGQLRGVSELQATLNLFTNMRDYRDSTIRASDQAAKLSYIVQTDMPPGESAEIEEGPCYEMPSPNGGGIVTPDGWKAYQLKAEQPVDTYVDFQKSLIRETGRNIGMPYSVAASDSSDMNYASGRLDHQTYYHSIDVERKYIEQRCLGKIWREWFNELMLSGSIPRVGPFRLRWHWDHHPHVDPEKEAKAAAILFNAGLMDEERYVSMTYGEAYDRFLDRQERSITQREERGLPLPQNIITLRAQAQQNEPAGEQTNESQATS